jgi:hypothetical protein
MIIIDSCFDSISKRTSKSYSRHRQLLCTLPCEGKDRNYPHGKPYRRIPSSIRATHLSSPALGQAIERI